MSRPSNVQANINGAATPCPLSYLSWCFSDINNFLKEAILHFSNHLKHRFVVLKYMKGPSVPDLPLRRRLVPKELAIRCTGVWKALACLTQRVQRFPQADTTICSIEEMTPVCLTFGCSCPRAILGSLHSSEHPQAAPEMLPALVGIVVPWEPAQEH